MSNNNKYRQLLNRLINNPRNLILLAIFLFIIYWKATDFIETNELYPISEKWFHVGIGQGYASSNCFHVEPTYLEINHKRGNLSITTSIEKKCNFTKAIITNHFTDLQNFSIRGERLNLVIDNSSDNSSETFSININGSSMEDNKPYNINWYIPLKKDFYSYYVLDLEHFSGIRELSFAFKHNIKGFSCDENCFLITGFEKEEPIFRGYLKQWLNNTNGKSTLRFSPKSEYWDLWLKILDTFILGFIVIFLYDAIKIFSSKENTGKIFGDIELNQFKDFKRVMIRIFDKKRK